MELECPALDMNDVSFCPSDPTYISAGCTDGSAYVWDTRRSRSDAVLHKLSHDRAINPLDERLPER